MSFKILLSAFLFFIFNIHFLLAQDLYVSAEEVDITPDKPVSLRGQFNLRVAKPSEAETPLKANIIVLQTRNKGKIDDEAIMVSCDLINFPPGLLSELRKETKKLLPELNPKKIFASSTHTHTAPETDVRRTVPDGAPNPRTYVKLLTKRIAVGIAKAYRGLKPGSLSWGLGHAVVAYNRRAAYLDGKSALYGVTDHPDFKGFEDEAYHGVPILYFFNETGKLIALAVNVWCPAQVVETRRRINADFWDSVRSNLRQKLGDKLVVLGWCGPAGDQSPHMLQHQLSAEARMMKLRGLSLLEEVGRRISKTVLDVYEVVKKDKHSKVKLINQEQTINLPFRQITETEFKRISASYEKLTAKLKKHPEKAKNLNNRLKWYGRALKRYKDQDKKTTFPIELHVLRIGDVAICTNPFELFTQYGIRMINRSRASLTIPIQLAGSGTYLPTKEAVTGGSYSAIAETCPIGPKGGKVLVDETVKEINKLWDNDREQISVISITKPLKLDGKANDSQWINCSKIILTPYNSKQKVSDVDSVVYALRDKDNLYFTFKYSEPYLDNMLFKKRKFDDKNIWQDYCLEMYLNPSNDCRELYQIIVNPSGSFSDLKISREKIGDIVDWNWNSGATVKTSLNGKEWITQIAIPIKNLTGFDQQKCPVNFIRTRILNKKMNYTQYYSWSPTINRFRDAQSYNILVFDK